MGQCEWKRLGDPFGLTQFGLSLETLQPGGQSALRHWHTLTDEFLYLLEGELVLRMNAGETTMTAGMCVGFKAGVRDGHHFVNRSDRPARYLILGSRIPGDNGFYPDDDLMWVDREDGFVSGAQGRHAVLAAGPEALSPPHHSRRRSPHDSRLAHRDLSRHRSWRAARRGTPACWVSRPTSTSRSTSASTSAVSNWA